jgi:class 3 adenylate cyclase
MTTAGDGIFATFDGPARAVAFALALREAVRAFGLKLRVGIHVGEVERMQDQVAGLAVHIASRISSSAEPGQILVSRTVRDLAVGAPIRFADCGTHALRGVPEPWQLYAVDG